MLGVGLPEGGLGRGGRGLTACGTRLETGRSLPIGAWEAPYRVVILVTPELALRSRFWPVRKLAILVCRVVSFVGGDVGKHRAQLH